VPAHRLLSCGEARITKAYCLPAKWSSYRRACSVQGGSFGEDELFSPMLQKLLFAGRQVWASRSIAFPAISAGAYGFPMQEGRAALLSLEMTGFLEGGGRQRGVEVIAVSYSLEPINVIKDTLLEL